MNTISLMLSDAARMRIYAAFALIGVAIGTIQVALSVMEEGTPIWLKVVLAVYAYLGGAFGYTAVTHTTNTNKLARQVQVAQDHMEISRLDRLDSVHRLRNGRHRDDDGDGQADFAAE